MSALNKDLKIPNMDALKNKLPEAWDIKEEADGTYTVTSPKGNEYKVDENGIVDETTDTMGEWWKLTEEESAMLDENRQICVAMKKEGNKTTGVVYAEEGSHIFVQIIIDLVGGMVEEDSLVLTFYSGDDVPEDINNSWANVHNEPFGVYTGECPISLDYFAEDEIYCRSLLERIIASFDK